MRTIELAFGFIAAASVACITVSAWAATPAEIQKSYEAAARAATPGFAGFSAQRGEQFFKTRHANDWSCSSCHTESPVGQGRHAKTGKTIAPLAPAANPQRFADAATVEKWFRRNCNDVLARDCTAQEKGDVMQYLMTLK